MNLEPIPNEPGLFLRDMSSPNPDVFTYKIVIGLLNNPQEGGNTYYVPAVVREDGDTDMDTEVELAIKRLKEATANIGGYDLTWNGDYDPKNP